MDLFHFEIAGSASGPIGIGEKPFARFLSVLDPYYSLNPGSDPDLVI
jgi:hypothetical protein